MLYTSVLKSPLLLGLILNQSLSVSFLQSCITMYMNDFCFSSITVGCSARDRSQSKASTHDLGLESPV